MDESGNLWVATGKDVYGIGFMKFDGNSWELFDRQNTPELPSNAYQNVSTYGNSVFLSNWGGGFTIYRDNTFTTYNTSNTDLIGITNNLDFLSIADVQEDSKGNIWILNNSSANRKQLSVLTADNQWFHFSITYPIVLTDNDAESKMVIDQYDTKWFIVDYGSVGLYYFNENNTFSNTGDDVQNRLTTSEGLISNQVSALAIDKQGQLWVGTSEGINLIRDPSRPISSMTTSTAFSVRNQTITCIAVDPLDQKWIGTKQGVFVLSPDGYQLIDYFTSKNSPIPNDDIRSIAINPTNGVAFVGTDNGMAALSTAFIQPKESFDEVFVYPNPLILDGSNIQITIDGLVQNSTIKVLDINNRLIRKIVSPGGRVAFWDGRDDNGNLVASGIYLLVAYDEEANNVSTAKIAVIRK